MTDEQIPEDRPLKFEVIRDKDGKIIALIDLWNIGIQDDEDKTSRP